MAASEKQLTKVYVSLDSLLDTRLGALALINTDFCFDVTTQKEYYSRQEDLFKTPAMGELSKLVFNDILLTHKQNIFRNSLKTKMPVFIRELCTKLFFQAMSTPFQSGVEIDVNIYPYQPNEAEVEGLLQALVECFGKEFSINLINKNNKQLTIEEVRQNYRCMVMYNYHEWMNVYENEIKKKPLRETGFYVPRLFFGIPPNEETLLHFENNNVDPFLFTQQIFAPLVPIQYLPIALYCADTPDNLPEYSAM